MSVYYTIIFFFVYFLLFVTGFFVTILTLYATVYITIDMVQTIIENLKEYRQKKKDKRKEKKEKKEHIDLLNKKLEMMKPDAESNKRFYELLSQRKELDQLLDRHPSLKLDYLRFMKNREKEGI